MSPCRLHTGNASYTLEHLLLKLMLPIYRISGGRLERREKNAPAVVPTVERAQVCEAPREQCGGRQQHERERDLRHNERTACPQPRQATDDAGRFLQRGIEIRVHSLNRWEEPEHESR
jgi:hypothetical protein